MKKVIALSLLMLNLSVYASEHIYWVEQSLCGELDPYVFGDACLIEVANDEENFAVVVDMDYVQAIEEEEGTEVKDLSAFINKSGLKKVTKSDREVLDGLLNSKTKLYTIDSKFIRFGTFQNDDE